MLLNVLNIISLSFLLTAYSTALLRQYKRITGERFSHVHRRFIRSLAARKLGCAITCLQTAECDAFQYSNNTSAPLNCELLMTSATDYDALTPAAGWSIYSSHWLLTTGRSPSAWFFCRHLYMSTHSCSVLRLVSGSWRWNEIHTQYKSVLIVNCAYSAGSCQQLTAYIAAVPNEALTASAEGFSSDGYNFGPENSRLFARNNATHAGGWVAAPETSETFHYIQVGACI